jgi:branched-chain amino acid aminotransferase
MSIIPFDDRDGFISYDGRLLLSCDAKLHVLSHFPLPTISAPS